MLGPSPLAANGLYFFLNGQELCLLYFNEEERSLKVQEQKEKLLMVRNWSDFCFNVLLAKQLNRNPFLLHMNLKYRCNSNESQMFTHCRILFICAAAALLKNVL